MRFGTSRIGSFRFDGGSSPILVFSGTAHLFIPSPILSGTFKFIRNVYVGQANLKIGQLKFAASAKHILPIYTGVASLRPKLVLIAAGKNIVEGFIYNEVLYVTETVVDQRNVDTRTRIL